MNKDKSILIENVLEIISEIGIPIDDLTVRRKDMMAMCILAIAGVFKKKDWSKAKSIDNNVSLKTREIIPLINENFDEEISSGSYDDIRRKHLDRPLLAGVVLNTKPNAAKNDSTRGYALNDDFKNLLVNYNTVNWNKALSKFKKSSSSLSEKLKPKRTLQNVSINIENQKFNFSMGDHNLLQKYIVEEFFPRFGHNAKILYLGDTADKDLFKDETELKKLNFFDLDHGKLPDVVAYSNDKNWLYLIEAVHSSGPISHERKYVLSQLLKDCKAELVFITAFLDKTTFRKFSCDIAWETDVWISEDPDHMIHFNGDKFIGPHNI